MNTFNNSMSNDDLSPISSLKSVIAQPTNSPTNYLANINWQSVIIIFLLMALLGFNIFTYLGQGTTFAADFTHTYIMPFFKFFGYEILETTKQTIEISGEGAKAGIDMATGSAVGVINAVEPAKQQTIATKQQTDGMPVQDKIQQSASEWNNTLETALANDTVSQSQLGGNNEIEAASSGVAGYCFIGEDSGVRTCSEVGVNDMCMSGDVFPTQDICVNPNLRT